MNRLMNFRITMFVVLLFWAHSITYGSGSAGTTGAEFLRINPDPRTVSMGEGAFGVFSSFPSAALSNPASLAGVRRPEVSLNYILFYEGMKTQFSSFAMPLSYGTVGFAVNYFSYGDFNGRYADFTKTDVPSSNDLSLNMTYCIPIRTTVPIVKDHGSLGVNLKFVRSKLADFTSEAIALDLGGIYKIPFVNGLNMGIVYKNLGSGLKYVKQTNDLPTSLGVGFAYSNYSWRNLTSVIDYDMPNAGPSSISLGVNISPIHFVSLRAGYKQTSDSLASGVRAGLGLKLGDFDIDYCFSPVDQLTPVHYASINFAIGSMFKQEDAFEYYIDEHLKKAIDYYYQHDYVLARQEFEGILSTYPDHSLSKKYLDKINDAIAKSKDKKDEKISELLDKAEGCLERRDYISAKKYYSYIMKMDSDNLKAKEGMKKITDVIKKARLAKVKDFNSAKIERIWAAAETAFKNGNFVLAKQKYNEILAIDPEHSASKDRIAECNAYLRKTNVVDVDNMFEQATNLFINGQYEEALKYFDAVVLAAPERSDAQDFVRQCKEKISAAAEKEKMRKLELEQDKMRNEMQLSYNKAVSYYEKNKFEKAYEAFNSARSIAEKYSFTEYTDKINSYTGLIKTGLSEQYYKEGFDEYQKSKFDKAIAAYKVALEYDPQNTSAKVELERISNELAQKYYEQGMLYFSQGNMEKARKSFSQSLSYNPNMKESRTAIERIK